MTAYENVANATETAGGGSTALAPAPKRERANSNKKNILPRLRLFP